MSRTENKSQEEVLILLDASMIAPPNNPLFFTPSVPQFWGKGFNSFVVDLNNLWEDNE